MTAANQVKVFHALLLAKHSSQSRTPVTSRIVTPIIAAAVLFTPAVTLVLRKAKKQNVLQLCAKKAKIHVWISDPTQDTQLGVSRFDPLPANTIPLVKKLSAVYAHILAWRLDSSTLQNYDMV